VIHSDNAAASLRRKFQRQLLAWFSRVRRDLPWRRDRDPYRIWVSEIMLQQTQVSTVIPYFERFLQAFPTIGNLAAADEQDVLRLWEGLGYYRRARNLHRAARIIAADHDGQMPRDPAALAALPGIGRYTVGAILSQAFDERLPILETNSERVLCRLFGRTDDPKRGPGRRWLWEMAETLLPSGRTGEFNQALMELGALVCSPVAPQCDECPLVKNCEAHRLGIEEEIPLRPAGPEAVVVQEAAVVVRRGRRLLLAQRPAEGRWASLWEFPHTTLEPRETHDAAAARLVAELIGIQADIGSELLTLRHSVTHYRITLVCFEGRYRSGRFRSPFYCQGKWVEANQLDAYPVSSPQRRLARGLTQQARQQQLF
jgi:A/G-specific adenine glycosylase